MEIVEELQLAVIHIDSDLPLEFPRKLMRAKTRKERIIGLASRIQT
jgi:hypothetical protein